MNLAYPLFLAAAVLVAACAPVQPAARPAVFTDAATGCRYAVAWDGRRVAVERCAPRRWGGVL